MKTKEQAKEYKSNCLDGRDMNRLTDFYTYRECLDNWGDVFNAGVTEEQVNADVKEWTRENILAQMEKDVQFGWEKAVDERGISCWLMAACVQMWCWVLEEGMEDVEPHGSYAKNYFKEVAAKYGWKLEYQ